jgi:hypothetical protein
LRVRRGREGRRQEIGWAPIMPGSGGSGRAGAAAGLAGSSAMAMAVARGNARTEGQGGRAAGRAVPVSALRAWPKGDVCKRLS